MISSCQGCNICMNVFVYCIIYIILSRIDCRTTIISSYNLHIIYNLLKKSQLKHMYYIKIPTVRFTGLVRPDPQGELFEGLKNLDGIRQNGLSGHLMMDGGGLRGWRGRLKG